MAEDKNAEQGEAGLGLESEDRLPWLEAADGVEEDGEVSPARLLVMVLGGLVSLSDRRYRVGAPAQRRAAIAAARAA